MADGVTILASFLLAFKAILVEGSEVAILSVATVKQLGKSNVLFGVLTGAGASVLIFLGVSQLILFLNDEALVEIVTGTVILYFSYRFLRGFRKYYFGKKSFRDKMKKMEDEVVEKDLEHYESKPDVVPFSIVNSLPVFTITLTEGFEASLVLGAAGSINFEWTLVGAVASLILIVAISAVSYEYLLRFPRWALDLIAGSVLLAFGTFFLASGLALFLFGVG